MKTNFHFLKLATVFTLALSIFLFSSCTKEESFINPESESSSGLTLKSAAIAQPDDMVCDLIAGQHINVGKVVYSHVGDNLLVEYVTSGGWTLSEVHFYVGNMADFKATCMNKKVVQIGHFPFSASNLNSTTKSFTISLEGKVPDSDGFMVVAHAVVKNGTQEETAFAYCTYKPLITLKTKFTNGTWAASDGERFSADYDNNYNWCYYLGTNIYEKGDIYLLRSNYYQYGGGGKVYVNDDGTNIEITVIPNAGLGLTLAATYVYVGNMKGLQSYVSGKCPDYFQFPNKITIPSSSHSFIIPIKKSISFKTAFDSNRWGWFSYYNF